MKKTIALFLVFALCLTLSACGVEQQKLELNFGESKKIELKSEQTDLVWTSNDPDIVSVEDATITAAGPGSTIVTAERDGEKIAEIRVSVNLVDISAILLGQKTIEIEVDESTQLSYVLMPENASDYGLSWKSTNTDIVDVDDDGTIHGVAPGTTTIIVSNSSGVMDTCEVTVLTPSAIDQLNEDERLLFNFMTESMLSSFYNASAVRIRDIYDNHSNSNLLSVILNIQGTNKMGGTLFKYYGVIITKSDGAGAAIQCNEDTMKLPALMSKDVMDSAKINAALEEYWSGNHY